MFFVKTRLFANFPPEIFNLKEISNSEKENICNFIGRGKIVTDNTHTSRK